MNAEFLRMLLDKGYVPVISPIGLGEDGGSLSINADDVAAARRGRARREQAHLPHRRARASSSRRRTASSCGSSPRPTSPRRLEAGAITRRHEVEGAVDPRARSRAAWSACTCSTGASRTPSSPSCSPTAASGSLVTAHERRRPPPRGRRPHPARPARSATQEELLDALARARASSATQATLSRDLARLGARARLVARGRHRRTSSPRRRTGATASRRCAASSRASPANGSLVVDPHAPGERARRRARNRPRRAAARCSARSPATTRSSSPPPASAGRAVAARLAQLLGAPVGRNARARAHGCGAALSAATRAHSRRDRDTQSSIESPAK